MNTSFQALQAGWFEPKANGQTKPLIRFADKAVDISVVSAFNRAGGLSIELFYEGENGEEKLRIDLPESAALAIAKVQFSEFLPEKITEIERVNAEIANVAAQRNELFNAYFNSSNAKESLELKKELSFVEAKLKGFLQKRTQLVIKGDIEIERLNEAYEKALTAVDSGINANKLNSAITAAKTLREALYKRQKEANENKNSTAYEAYSMFIQQLFVDVEDLQEELYDLEEENDDNEFEAIIEANRQTLNELEKKEQQLNQETQDLINKAKKLIN